jgi:phage recombination protein Bet
MNAVTEFKALPRTSLVARMAERFGVDPDKMLITLRATAFKGDVSNEQMMALMVVAEQHGLNPWTKEIYAFPDSRNGIVPVVGVDGWSRIINDHPQFNGMDFEEAEDGSRIKCTIHRKDRAHPISITEWLSECKRDTQPWKSHPRRMLRHKALIQCARVAFGFSGIYDPDEAERIVETISVDAKRIDPRGDLSGVDNEMVMDRYSTIVDLLNQDKETHEIAEDLRQYEAEFLQPFAELYVSVLDKLAREKIITKSKWKEYLKISLDRGETHTS